MRINKMLLSFHENNFDSNFHYTMLGGVKLEKFKIIRNRLLKEKEIHACRELLSFFDEPRNERIELICSVIKNDTTKLMVHELMEYLVNLFSTKKLKYYEQISYGQKIIWNEIVNCFEKVIQISNRVENQRKKTYIDDYILACEQVHMLLEFYAQSQALLSHLEDTLGVDRYLDKVSEADFELLEELLSRQRKCIEGLCTEYKVMFQKEWNLTNIPRIIFHKLSQYNGENQICSSLIGNQKRVLLFVVDGFGYCQYLWNKELGSGRTNFTYKENIFTWLKQENCMSEYILGSAYVSDTSAGLAQIFLGQSAKETGIISSKLQRSGETHFFETKKIPNNEFLSIFNITKNSITDIVASLGMRSKVFYCSRYSTSELGFSKSIFKSAEIEPITPAERAFSVLKDYLDEEMSDGLAVIYLSNIDNSGHTMGAYSRFEKYEHEKLNSLFKNFMIELATSRPEIFNGDTSIMFVADHGMVESAKKMISRFEIINLLQQELNVRAKVVENNRAMLLYGIPLDKHNNTKITLKNYFESINIEVEITCKLDEEYDTFFCNEHNNFINNISPDIVIRMISNGLFYSNQTINPHLMHYGGHGGASFGESFVPLLDITLNKRTLDAIYNRFTNIM